ncbi:MurR/RpiR family transcriptional regulator [Leucobacter sp. GX0328]
MWPQQSPSLTPGEQAVERFARDEPLKFATLTGAEIAARTETSDATVARTAQKLGFANVREMKACCASRVQEQADLQHVLQTRLEALRTHGTEDDGPSGESRTMTSVLTAAAGLVLGVESSIHWPAAAEAAAAIAAAPRAFIYGLGTAYCFAQYAELEFARIGIVSRGITGSGHTNAHAVFQIDAADAVLVLAPRVIFADVHRFIEAAARKGARVFVIAQASLPPQLHELGVLHLRMPSSGGGAATEAVPTVSLIDALVAEIATLQPERALDARAQAQAYRGEFSR